jgi:GntR family transcriptional regulator, transcriptional repressor for pyruvate dehydrogenase complex
MTNRHPGNGSATGNGSANVVDETIDRLRGRIESGELAPGAQLPPEAVLAAELRVSRLSLREAVRALGMAGVLDVRHGRGTFVTDLKPDRMVNAIGRFLELADDTAVGELFECRRVLEPGATALAATRITDPALDALHARLDVMRALRDPEQLVREDLAFHAAIVTATGNATLESLSSTIAQRTARARIWRALVKSDVLEWTHQQHLDIFHALRDRDSHSAYIAANRHVSDVEKWVTERLRPARAHRAAATG